MIEESGPIVKSEYYSGIQNTSLTYAIFRVEFRAIPQQLMLRVRNLGQISGNSGFLCRGFSKEKPIKASIT
jgi:hypothetical protein